MEDYSKGHRSEREITAGHLEQVRGPIRGASLLWREACSARSRLRLELAHFLTKRLPQCCSSGTRPERAKNYSLPLRERANTQLTMPERSGRGGDGKSRSEYFVVISQVSLERRHKFQGAGSPATIRPSKRGISPLTHAADTIY
jgi:hypothetical protein